MNTRWVIGILIAATAIPATGDAAKQLADTKDKAGALARFVCTMKDEFGSRTVEGQAVCIATEPAVFLTMSLDARVPPDSLSGFLLIPAKAPEARIGAELLGVDPELNIGFLRATEPYDWTVVQFAPKANLTVGQQVSSVGLMGRESNYEPYVGLGYVSAVLRIPGTLAYVTGGRLSGLGSPVFNADGRAIGLVSPQRFLNYQMALGGRVTNVGLIAEDEAAYFLPVDEFAHVILNIPSSPQAVRRLPWIGVMNFNGVAKEVAEIMSLDTPGVMIEGVIPDGPAAKVGLKDRDVVVAVNGEPFPPVSLPDMTAMTLQRKLYRMSPGQKVTLTVRRGETTKDYELTLEAVPQMPYEARRYLSRELGFLVREKIDLDRYVDKSAAAGVPGLIVIAVDESARDAGLREGDLITTIDNTAVTTVEGLKQVAETAVAQSQPVVLVVRRGEQTQTITLQPLPQTVPQPQQGE